MRKIKEVLRLRYEKGLSAREIAQSLDIERGTIGNYLDRIEKAGLTWSLSPELEMPRPVIKNEMPFSFLFREVGFPNRKLN